MKDLFGNELSVGDRVAILHISDLGSTWWRHVGKECVVASTVDCNDWGNRWQGYVHARRKCNSVRTQERSWYVYGCEVVKIGDDGRMVAPAEFKNFKALVAKCKHEWKKCACDVNGNWDMEGSVNDFQLA